MLKFVHYRGQATTCCQQQAGDWAVDKMNEVNRGHGFNKRSSATFFCLQAAVAILLLLTNCLTLFRYKLVLLWGYCHTPQDWWWVQLRVFSSSVISPYFISVFLELTYWKQRYFTAIDDIVGVRSERKGFSMQARFHWQRTKEGFNSPSSVSVAAHEILTLQPD